MDKEYCIIGFDNSDAFKDDIISISTDNPDFVISKKMVISRFKSNLDANNMYEVFNTKTNGSFFIFELNPLTSAVHIGFPEYQDLLFKTFDKNKEILNENSGDLSTPFGFMSGGIFGDNIFSMLNLLNSDDPHKMAAFGAPPMNNNKDVKKEEVKYTEEMLSGYTKAEKQELIDKLIIKGSELTDEDKRVLDFLVKN